MSYADWIEHHGGEFTQRFNSGEAPSFVTVNGKGFSLDESFEIDSYAITMGLCRPFYHGSIPQISCFGRNFLVACYLDSQGANLATCVSGLLSGCSYAYLGVDEFAAVMYMTPGVAEIVGYTELLIEDVMIAQLDLDIETLDAMLVKYSSQVVTKSVFAKFAPKMLDAVDYSDVVDVRWDQVLGLKDDTSSTDMMSPFSYKLSSMAMLYFTHLTNDLDEQHTPLQFFERTKLMLIDYDQGENQWVS